MLLVLDTPHPKPLAVNRPPSTVSRDLFTIYLAP